MLTSETPYHHNAVLLYSHDGFGLGHLKRNVTIAKRTVYDFPGSKALLITGHSSLPGSPLPYGIDFIKLPSIIKAKTGVWQPRSLPIENERLCQIRSAMILKAAEYFVPNIFLVDYTPTGVWGELVETLEMLKSRPEPPTIILGLRDILDAPEVTCKIWKTEGNYEAIRNYYDKIFIYGRQEIYDTAFHYGLTDDLSEKILYTDYLCSDEPCKPQDQIREELQVKKENLVLVTAGGGYDAYPMMRLAIKALGILMRNLSFEAIFITGPLMKAEHRESLQKQAKNLPIRILRSVEGTLNYMSAANLIVTMGSYNTLMDAVRLQKSVIVIPREGPSAEQKIRAQLLSQMGLISALKSPALLSPFELAESMLKNLTQPQTPPIFLAMNGLTKAVSQIGNFFESNKQLQPLSKI